MTVVVETAQQMGAEGLLDIAGAHVDSCLYHGRAGLDFALRLREGGAKVVVPTTLNVASLDLLHPELTNSLEHRAEAKQLMDAYIQMGGRPTWTCAPYQGDARPRLGEQVAWAESNAVVFVNSVLGARSNRYGDFIDIACAVTGRAPAAGLHLDEGRRAQVVIEIGSDLPLDQDWLYPVLGCIVGRIADLSVPALVGLPDHLSEDRLKALGAGAATTGGVALFHAPGSTPESPGELGLLPSFRVGPDEVAEMRDLLSTHAGPVQAVSLGGPHYSVAEMRSLAEMLAGREVRLPTYVNTSRAVVAIATESVAEVETCGVQVVTDTCTYLAPIMAPGVKAAMTDSSKWAYYAPANLGIEVVFASTSECVEAAIRG